MKKNELKKIIQEKIVSIVENDSSLEDKIEQTKNLTAVIRDLTDTTKELGDARKNAKMT